MSSSVEQHPHLNVTLGLCPFPRHKVTVAGSITLLREFHLRIFPGENHIFPIAEETIPSVHVGWHNKHLSNSVTNQRSSFWCSIRLRIINSRSMCFSEGFLPGNIPINKRKPTLLNSHWKESKRVHLICWIRLQQSVILQPVQQPRKLVHPNTESTKRICHLPKRRKREYFHIKVTPMFFCSPKPLRCLHMSTRHRPLPHHLHFCTNFTTQNVRPPLAGTTTTTLDIIAPIETSLSFCPPNERPSLGGGEMLFWGKFSRFRGREKFGLNRWLMAQLERVDYGTDRDTITVKAVWSTISKTRSYSIIHMSMTCFLQFKRFTAIHDYFFSRIFPHLNDTVASMLAIPLSGWKGSRGESVLVVFRSVAASLLPRHNRYNDAIFWQVPSTTATKP